MKRFLMVLIILAGIFIPGIGAATEPPPVTIFAAASATNAIRDIAAAFTKHSSIPVRTSFASSSTLAKQIQNGAPADIYISANVKWMDFLEAKGALAPGSRRDLLGNRLVMVAPAASKTARLVITPDLDLSRALHGGRLAVGDTDHVPAGMYAKKALISLKLWDKVKTSLAPGKDVRAALALVVRGEVPFGIVYATDAAITPDVSVVGTFPESSHPAITYPVSQVAGKTGGNADAFFLFLTSDTARSVFKSYGFEVR